MIDQAVEDAAEEVMERDPRNASYGFYSGGSFVLDSVRVFSWFETIEDMSEFLLKIEPAVCNLEGDDLIRYQTAAEPILQRLQTEGFSAKLLVELNTIAKRGFVVDWWGEFSEIVGGKTDFAKGILSSFLDDEATLSGEAEQMDEFVDYLKTIGC